jgi:hypothetical protein
MDNNENLHSSWGRSQNCREDGLIEEKHVVSFLVLGKGIKSNQILNHRRAYRIKN